MHTRCMVVWTVNSVMGCPLDRNQNQCVALFLLGPTQQPVTPTPPPSGTTQPPSAVTTTAGVATSTAGPGKM